MAAQQVNVPTQYASYQYPTMLTSSMPVSYNQTNFISTVNTNLPVIHRPKPVFAPSIFTAE